MATILFGYIAAETTSNTAQADSRVLYTGHLEQAIHHSLQCAVKRKSERAWDTPSERPNTSNATPLYPLARINALS